MNGALLTSGIPLLAVFRAPQQCCIKLLNGSRIREFRAKGIWRKPTRHPDLTSITTHAHMKLKAVTLPSFFAKYEWEPPSKNEVCELLAVKGMWNDFGRFLEYMQEKGLKTLTHVVNLGSATSGSSRCLMLPTEERQSFKWPHVESGCCVLECQPCR